MIHMKRFSLGRKLHKCQGTHIAEVVWTVKTLGEFCQHTKIQPECYKLCCRCCPHSRQDIPIEETIEPSVSIGKEKVIGRKKKRLKKNED
jgi:hypothetical protein